MKIKIYKPSIRLRKIRKRFSLLFLILILLSKISKLLKVLMHFIDFQAVNDLIDWRKMIS